MPIHDWTRVPAGVFHHFHFKWIASLCDTLNGGNLPSGYAALAEQPSGGVVPDVLTLQRESRRGPRRGTSGVGVAMTPPRTRFVQRSDADLCAARANHVAIHHPLGEVVAVIELVSPGNKSGRGALNSFVEKAAGLLGRGIHLLVIDLFPPTKRDPQGIHQAIWDELKDEPFELPRDKPLTLVSYSASVTTVAYVEPVAVGDLLPDMPLFLEPEMYIPAALEASYQSAWDSCPEVFKDAVLLGLPPEASGD